MTVIFPKKTRKAFPAHYEVGSCSHPHTHPHPYSLSLLGPWTLPFNLLPLSFVLPPNRYCLDSLGKLDDIYLFLKYITEMT